jgi:hypothetical protein
MSNEIINLLLSGLMGILGGLSLIIPNMLVSRALKRDELSLQHRYNLVEKRNELLIKHSLELAAKKREILLQQMSNDDIVQKQPDEKISNLEDRIMNVENRLGKLEKRYGDNGQ